MFMLWRAWYGGMLLDSTRQSSRCIRGNMCGRNFSFLTGTMRHEGFTKAAAQGIVCEWVDKPRAAVHQERVLYLL